jgi:hypothetical protein
VTFAEASGLVQRHAKSGVAIDCNLLLPLLVGTFDPNLVEKFKRTRKYAPPSIGLLQKLVAPISRLFITPHVLTEVSNLTGQLRDSIRVSLRETIASAVRNFDERRTPSMQLVARPLFPRLGLTDAALAELTDDGVLVLTDDLPLYLEITKLRHPALYFTHLLRDEYFSSPP